MHIHLIVEAPGERALARGMQGLGVRIAKALNRVMGRKGTVLADHYHARQLRSPTQVANALAYVLMNFLHHFPGEKTRHAGDLRDPFSSAWREQGKDPPVVAPRTWLLSIGWRIRADARPTSSVRASGSIRSRHSETGGRSLELALVLAGKIISASPQFRAGQIEQWGQPVKEPAALFLPLPMNSLQGMLENLRGFLERLRTRGRVDDDWKRAVRGTVKEIAADLATLAAHLPIQRAISCNG